MLRSLPRRPAGSDLGDSAGRPGVGDCLRVGPRPVLPSSRRTPPPERTPVVRSPAGRVVARTQASNGQGVQRTSLAPSPPGRLPPRGQPAMPPVVLRPSLPVANLIGSREYQTGRSRCQNLLSV
eukprot:scaffold94885_cov69-Phaeocystis_antarctica.AAC.6